jgi:hypothetical protein
VVQNWYILSVRKPPDLRLVTCKENIEIFCYFKDYKILKLIKGGYVIGKISLRKSQILEKTTFQF